MVQKKEHFCKVCVVLIAVAVLMMCTCIGVFAADGDSPVTVRSEDGTEVGYETLVEAGNAAKDGDTILLNENIEMGFFELNGRRQNPTMVVTGKTITLDGQGHTVTAKNEAFSMIEVEATGVLTVKNIIMDGSADENRRFSNIINIEGGEVTIEDGTVLKNNCTGAISIGTNIPGGKCTMNGGLITENVMPAGSNDTGVAVTVLEESTFIMKGGTISKNQTVKYGSSGIMVNRGGTAILNGGTIENNTTSVNGMASAVHIKGGYVELNGTTIQNNTSADGYGAVYVTDHSSFGEKWDGILDINGGAIKGNKNANGTANAIYLWDRSSIADKGAYIYFSGSPDIDGTNIIMSNSSSDVDFKLLKVDGTFTPVRPVELKTEFYYITGQPIVQYTEGVEADSEHFIAEDENYGFQEDKENNLLYTEARRKVVFMDGDGELTELAYWEFVEDTVLKPEYQKVGYSLDGWYTDKELTDEWNFENDIIPRETGKFVLYSKWSAIPAEAPDLTEKNEIILTCGDTDGTTMTADFEENTGYTYSYVWEDAAGETIGQEKSLTVASPDNGQKLTYTLTVTAVRTDNGEQAQASAEYIVSRAEHKFSTEWEYNDTRHWHVCTDCGESNNDAEHTFKWVIDKAATAEEKGYKHEECEICGYKRAPVEIAITTDPDKPDDTKPSDPSTPQTGDERGMAVWFVIAGICAVGIAGVTMVSGKRGKVK